jgi:putative hydroxymethylpyrimidine transport system substrate-binding protein
LGCLVTLKSNHIDKIEDLKGKKVGYSAGIIDTVMMQTLLQAHGLQLRDIQFINVHYDLVKALLSKKIDAFTGAMRNFEPIQLQQNGQPAQLFLPEDNGFPPYDELIFITQRDRIRDPRLTQFVTALKEGVQYLRDHPEESWKLVIKAHPELNNSLNKAVWFDSIRYFAQEPGKLDMARYQSLAVFMFNHDIIKHLPETAHYAVQLN